MKLCDRHFSSIFLLLFQASNESSVKESQNDDGSMKVCNSIFVCIRMKVRNCFHIGKILYRVKLKKLH